MRNTEIISDPALGAPGWRPVNRRAGRLSRFVHQRVLMVCLLVAAPVGSRSQSLAAGGCDPQFEICFQGIGQLPGAVSPSSEALGVAHANGRVVAVGVSNGVCSGGINCTKAVKFTAGPLSLLRPILNDVTNRRSNNARDVALVGTTTVVTGTVATFIPGTPPFIQNRTVVDLYRAVQTADEAVEPFILPSTFGISVKAISDIGDVIVGNGTEDPLDPSLSGRPFRWTASSGTSPVHTSLGFLSTANGVSPNGVFVVGVSNGVPYIFPPPGDPCVTINCVPQLLGFDPSVGAGPLNATGVTNTGVIVGMASVQAGGHIQAYRWTPGNGQAPPTLTLLTKVPDGMSRTEALGVAGDAQTIVGVRSIVTTPFGPLTPTAALWHSHLGMRSLIELAEEHGATGLAGWTLQKANAVSTNGLAVAGSGINPAGKPEGWLITLPDCNGNNQWDAVEAVSPMTRASRSVIRLDGVNDFLELAAPSPELLITGDLTIEAWIYLHRTGVAQSVIAFGAAGESLDTNVLYSIEVDSGGDLVIAHERADSSDAVAVADTDLRTGRWYHLGVTRKITSPSSVEYAVYVDDLPPVILPVSGLPVGGTAGRLRIGHGENTPPDRPFAGFISDLRIWNVARTTQDIRRSMFTPAPSDTTGLVGSWTMDETIGDTIFDGMGPNDLSVMGGAIRQAVGADCNNNRIPDSCDVDCNQSGIPDECEVRDGDVRDCDVNGRPDECDASDAIATLFSAEQASTEVFRVGRDDPNGSTTFGDMIERYGRPWKPGTGQTPGGGVCLGGGNNGAACNGNVDCPDGNCEPPPGTGTTRDPAERLRMLIRQPACVPDDDVPIPSGGTHLVQRALGELFAFEMLLGNEAFADAMDPTVGEGALSEGISLEQVPGLYAFRGLPGVGSLLSEELALLRGREIALPASSSVPFNDDPAGDNNGNYPSFGSATTRAAVYNRLRPNATGTLGSIAYRSNYGFDSTTSQALASQNFPQGHGDAYGYYLTATKAYLDVFGAAGETPVPAAFADGLIASMQVSQGSPDCGQFDCETVLDDDGVIHLVGFQSVRNLAAAMAARARTANRIVDLTFRRDYREEIDMHLTDLDAARAWGTADWARRGGMGAYFDWAVLNHLLPVPEVDTQDVIESVHRERVDEVRMLASAVDEMQERVDAAGAGFNPLALVPNVVPFRIIQPGQLLDFLQGGASSGQSHYGIVRDAAVEAINNARGILKRANLAANRLRGNESDFADFEDQVRQTDSGLNDRLIEIFGLPSPSDFTDNDFEDNDGDGVQAVGGINDPDDDFLESGCAGACAGSPDLQNFLIDEQGYQELGFVKRPAVGQIQLAMFELRKAALNLQAAELSLANLEALIDDKAENVALLREEAVEELEILATACADRQKVLDRKEQLAKLRENRGKSSKIMGVIGSAAACVTVGLGCSEAKSGALAVAKERLSDLAGSIDPIADAFGIEPDPGIGADFDLQSEELRINCWQTASLTTISNEQDIRAKEIELEDLMRKTPLAILELAGAENTMRQALAVVEKNVKEGGRLVEERERIRRVQTDKLQDFRFRDLAFRTFRNQALEQYGAFFDLAGRYVMLAARAFAYEYNERDEVAVQVQRLYQERLLGSELVTDEGLESVIARLDQKRQESAFLTRLQKLSLFDHGGDEFSLRKNFLGLAIDPANDTNQQQLDKNKAFRAHLESNIVQDLLDVPAFRDLASIDTDRDAGPALVLNFSTEVAGRTLFGRRRGTTFGAPANFDTCSNPKLFEFAILLEGVDNPSALGVDGPLVFAHFIPVGTSMLRAPETGNCALRPVNAWQVVDQRIPGVSAVYRDTGGAIIDAFAIPRLATSPELNVINRFPVTQAQVRSTDTPIFQDELAGWSVWNTQWLIAIPGRQFTDPNDPPDLVRKKLLILIFDADASGNPRSPDQNLGIDDIKLRIKAYGSPS